MEGYISTFKKVEQTRSRHLDLTIKSVSLKKDLEIWEAEMRALVGRIEDNESSRDIYKSLKQQIPQGYAPQTFTQRLFGAKPVPIEQDHSKYEDYIKALELKHKKLVETKETMDRKKELLIKQINEIEHQLTMIGKPTQGLLDEIEDSYEEKNLLNKDDDEDAKG
jgi:hypothetical protein